MKYKIYLEYCGANYAGWQKQHNAKTVQGTLIDTVKTIFINSKGKSKFIDLQGSGRTDKGVHALCQTAHLECETMLAPEILKMKMNDLLPSDINILEIEKASDKFHARHSAKSRSYIYQVSKRRTAFEKRFVWWVKDKLNVRAMQSAAKLFEGRHDFKSFSDDTPDEKSTIAVVENISVTEDDMKIYIRIQASHFLWKMVRRIVGVLVEAGRGRLSNEDIQSFLTSYSEEPAKYTAPPSGLLLENVIY
jgi:tRNA pseudouridine38-40 synthase